MNALTGETEARREQAAAPGVSGDQGMETLLRCIRGNLFNEARETLDRLLASAGDAAEKQKLAAAREKIAALDFEQAEKLLLGECPLA
jgi:hypothetical protein